MTLPAEHLAQTFEMVREAKKASEQDPESWGGAQVLGVNMEGPYINVERKGAHVAEYIQAPDVEFTKQFADVIKLVTIAPEVPGGMEFRRKRISCVLWDIQRRIIRQQRNALQGAAIM